MTKVAIVGTSHNMTDNEERDVRQLIGLILNGYSKGDTVITGGAKGVDSIAVSIAQTLGFNTMIIKPKSENWDSYKERNLEIARYCDELYCISIPVHTEKCYHHKEPQDHQKTAGCWTMNKAIELGKDCKLLLSLPR